MKKVSILDSSLRDGAQGIGISFSVEDKLNMVKVLDSFGVEYIEAGNPASNPKELEFFSRLGEIKLKNSKVCAFGSTRRKNTKVEEDANLAAIMQANTDVCVIFGKSWKLHVDTVLETTYKENLSMIEESCAYLKSHNKEVIYDAEHFFDGYNNDADYAIETIKAAERGGANIICLCDTNGGTFPDKVSEIVEEVKKHINVELGVHFHDDCGVAVANSIVGTQSGASHVQGTFLGFGERCGNANLSSIIPCLQLKFGVECVPQESLSHLTETAKEVAAITNIDINSKSPFVGKYAFAHKAGMHADGVLKNPVSFEHINPELVGNIRRFPTSEISGKAVIFEKIKRIFPNAKIDSGEVKEILAQIKEMELNGYQFEGADASLELIVRNKLTPQKPYFKLLYYAIDTTFSPSETGLAKAIVKVMVGDKEQLMAAEGNGPVNALDAAIRKALEVFYPSISKVKLTDYKVRVLDSKNATASGVRVLITTSDGKNSYTTVGVSEDVVAASWKALEDSLEFVLLKTEEIEKNNK